MNKKTMLLIGAAILLIAVVAAAVRVSQHGRDIGGVTSLGNTNEVIMNAYKDHDFVCGKGKLTVGEGEHIHLEYNLKSGSFDVAVAVGNDELYEALMKIDGQNMENLPVPDDWQSFEEAMADTDGVQGQGGIEGRGSLDFEAAPGDYTVVFYPHEAVGRAVATAAQK